MTKGLKNSVAIIAALFPVLGLSASEKLTGNVVGTKSYDYNASSISTTTNTPSEAFDGDMATFFASSEASLGWAGLELDQKYVIKRIGFAPRNSSDGGKKLLLGVFQGATQPDFSDALPLYLISEPAESGKMTYVDVECSRAFQYVRYVGPHESRADIAEIEFYGDVGEGDDSHLYTPTNLPLVVVNTPNMEWFNNDKNKEFLYSHIAIIKDGTIDVEEHKPETQVRGRGNASWNFPKKPFRIKFEKKQTVLGGPAKAKKWTMISNYSDKSLVRNKLSYEISRIFGLDFTPVCHFVDCIFNGEYQGSYQLCDQVEVTPNRVDITEMEPTDVEGELLSGGYLIEVDAYADREPADEWFSSTGPYQIPVTIKSPDPGISQQYNYICNRFTQMETAVASENFKDPDVGYRAYLDIDTFLKHFLINEMTGNTDTYWSTYMTLERGADKFRVGPVWDFDLSFDNNSMTYPINKEKPEEFGVFRGNAAHGMMDLAKRIINDDPYARERMSYLWSLARKFGGLTSEGLGTLIDSYNAELAQSQRLNFIRWDILKTTVHENPVARGTFEAEIGHVRECATQRVALLDQKIGYNPDVVEEEVGPEETFAITVYAGKGGTVEPVLKGLDLANIRAGRDVAIAITPHRHSIITSVTVDGEDVAVEDPNGLTINFENIAANHSIAVTFNQTAFSVMCEKNPLVIVEAIEGDIELIEPGQNVSFSVRAVDPGVGISAIMINGVKSAVEPDEQGAYIFNIENVTEDIVLVIEAQRNYYVYQVEVKGHGYVNNNNFSMRYGVNGWEKRVADDRFEPATYQHRWWNPDGWQFIKINPEDTEHYYIASIDVDDVLLYENDCPENTKDNMREFTEEEKKTTQHNSIFHDYYGGLITIGVEDPSTNHLVRVIFRGIPVGFGCEVGENGTFTIEADGEQVYPELNANSSSFNSDLDYGSKVRVTFTPNEGYEIEDVNLDGSTIEGFTSDSASGFTYTIDCLDRDIALGASFKEASVSGDSAVDLTVDSGENGAPCYYNLQGICVAQPIAGQTYIVIRGTTATKCVFR